MTDLTLFSSGTAASVDAATTSAAVGARNGKSPADAGATPVAGALPAERRAVEAAVAGAGGGPEQHGTAAMDGSPTAAMRAPEENAAHAVGLLEELVATLRSLGGDWLEERLGLVGRCEARMASVKSDTVTELARRDGEAHAAEAVRARLRGSRGSAKRDVKLAGQLADMPETAEALAAGAITPQHARMIAEAAEHTAVDEAELLAAAGHEPTDVFGHTLRNHVNERTAGEELEQRRRRQRARREVSITKQSDGMYKLFGLFDPVAGARIETALAAAARKLRRAEDPQNRATPAQRSADALELLVTRAGAGKNQSTTLVVIAEYDHVAGQLAGAELVDGTPLAPGELVKLALEAKILPALFDVEGQPLWLGREQRDASTAQRIALAARDRGCVGCGAPNSYCQPHHIEFWENGGPTDLDNLCLLCGHCHHKLVHELGAQVVRGSEGRFSLRDPDRKSPANCGRRDRRDGVPGASVTEGGSVDYPLLR